jgi:hypothetical protein
MAACGTLRPASVGGGECRVFERPEYAVLGQTRYDQNWIDSNTEAGVAACGWQRPKPRPQRPSKQLAPATKEQLSLIGRIKRAVAPSASAQSSPQVLEQQPVPVQPAKKRDPVDELLEPSDAPPAYLQPRRCWWC